MVVTKSALDVGTLVTVRDKYTGQPVVYGAVVGFDHEHQFVCVQTIDVVVDGPIASMISKYFDVDEDRLTIGWSRK